MLTSAHLFITMPCSTICARHLETSTKRLFLFSSFAKTDSRVDQLWQDTPISCLIEWLFSCRRDLASPRHPPPLHQRFLQQPPPTTATGFCIDGQHLCPRKCSILLMRSILHERISMAFPRLGILIRASSTKTSGGSFRKFPALISLIRRIPSLRRIGKTYCISGLTPI